jgi:uncharacterized protein
MNARLIREHPLAAFFVLAYALAWLAWLPLVLGRDGLALLDVSVPIEAILPGTFAPALAALLGEENRRGGLVARSHRHWLARCHHRFRGARGIADPGVSRASCDRRRAR